MSDSVECSICGELAHKQATGHTFNTPWVHDYYCTKCNKWFTVTDTDRGANTFAAYSPPKRTSDD